jgi:ribosomal-protein-alanine N-acetyltransferase
MTAVRPGAPGDLGEIRAIQSACPEAAQWDPASYLQYDLLVATEGFRVVGFLAARTLAPGESELLNVAVAPDQRRKGIGRTLVMTLVGRTGGTIFLEVRPSNRAARSLYNSLGFEDVATRPDYYSEPPEPAIVMKFHSC